MGARKRKTTDKTVQKAMFDELSENPSADKAATFYFVTNRFNLLEILSSGWIKPAIWYPKYYRDLGEACPERIPLLLDFPSERLINEVFGSVSSSFPVLVEVDLLGMKGCGLRIDRDFRPEETDISAVDSGLCFLVNGTVPSSRVSKVYFRSEQELQDYRVRSFSNVPLEESLLSVNPDAFTGPEHDTARFLEAIADVARNSPQDSHNYDSKTPGALGGALTMLFKLSEANYAVSLELLANCINQLAGLALSNTETAATGNPNAAAAILAVLNVLTEAPSVRTSLESGNTELLLIQLITRQLASSQLDEFYGEGFLELVYAEFQSQLEEWFPNATDIWEDYARGFSSIQDTITGISEIDEILVDAQFRDVPTLTALTIFLLKPEPEKCLTWNDDSRLQDNFALMMALAFSGALYGRSRIPTDARPSKESLRLLDELTALALNRESGGLSWDAPYSTTIDTTEVRDYTIETLSVDGAILVKRKKPVAKPEKWFERILALDLKNERHQATAIELCNVAGWTDCIVTEILLQGRDFILEHHARKPHSIRIEGKVEINERIHEDRFFRRVNELPLSEGEKLITGYLRNLLEEDETFSQ